MDPSKGTANKSGDSTAIVVGHLDKTGVIWVEQSFLEKATIPLCVDRAVTFFQNYKPRAFGIEVNGFQEQVAQRIAEEAVRRGILNMPVLKITNTAGIGTEKSRITVTLDPILAQGRMRFRRTPSNERIINEFKTFPSGDHDDGPDACEMLVQTFAKLLGK
jgi:predicted phage terminase large subunit-like protein